MPDIPELGWDGTLWRLLLAAVLGGLIGLEPELDEKAAGLRTHMLVTVGAALFTLELRIDRDQRTGALAAVADLPEVAEARWTV